MSASRATPWRIVDDGVALRVRLTPKAGRNRIDGLAPAADGATIVKASVTAVPEGGKANAALIRLLAKTWHLPRTALAVTGGATSRLKTVTIRGDGRALAATLEAWRSETETDCPKESA